MFEYIVRSPFKMGDRIMSKGEALSLSSLKATAAVHRGFLLEKNVSGLQDIVATCENRARVLVEKLQLSPEVASTRAMGLATSLLIRHESLKTFKAPTPAFLAEVEEFNRTATGSNPITKINSLDGAGEWAGYNCNIGKGCSHDCLYCYAENMAVTRFKRVGANGWGNEIFRDVSTKKCKLYDEPIMFPTTHDITPTYLPAYKCHLYNILAAKNTVMLVSKPHRESIEAICTEFTSFRDSMTFRFSIGGLNDAVMRHWEPGAPPLSERLECLQYAFELGFKTSVSAEPMLCGPDEAEKLYYTVEPYVTDTIWFGKMKYIAGLKNDSDQEIAAQAVTVLDNQTDDEIQALVDKLRGLPKVKWKKSIRNTVDTTNNNDDDIAGEEK